VSRDGLVTAAGRPVLGARGPIAVRTAAVAITEQGEVIEGGQTVDTLRIVDFPAPYRLAKEGLTFSLPRRLPSGRLR
jgi:flagellar basal body rod protein FlgG